MTTTTLGRRLENAIIHGAIPSTTVTHDPDTGNPRLVESPIEIYCYFKSDKSPPIDIQQTQPGNLGTQWVEGWVTRTIPPIDLIPLQSGLGISATIGGVGDGVIPGIKSGIHGDFYAVPVIQNAAIDRYNCRKHVGLAIRGWFAPKTINAKA